MGFGRTQYNASVGTSAAQAVAFGFPAVTVALSLQSCGPVYVNFSTALGTTGGFRLSSGTMTNPFILDPTPPISGLGLSATTTGPVVDVLGLGG